MNESLLEYAVKRLKATKGNWPRVARAADVEYFWLVKLANGSLKNPSYRTVEKLAKYLKSVEVKKAKANGTKAVPTERG